ncbi:MAG: M6 family metalloprotease domain-containing protein, partial [Bacteroidota bacterium]
GYMVMSAKGGAYEYAVGMKDGRVGFSGVAAHDPGRRAPGESAFLGSIQPGLFYSKAQVKEMRAFLSGSHAPNATAGGFPTTGIRAHLMILANFNNTTTTYTQTNFNNLMNQVNYNSTGSFRDYYLEVSYGLLTVNTTVTVWVTLPHPHDYYGPQSMWGNFAYDAVVAADQQAGVNYALYDNDGDGVVDGVCIAHQGRGQEESGNTNDIWSHSWDLSSAGYTTAQCTFDGVEVLDYTTIPEKGSSTTMSSIGVMCHEFGHNLGAPDFYDTDYSTGGQYDGTGGWDIMAGGSWNGSPAGSRPAHHNAWTKNFYTWTTPTVLTTQQTVLLRRAETYTDAVRYNTTTPNEYFLCENRQQTGFDADLPGHGMIIYHVDGSYISAHSVANDINATSHQGLFPMSAISSTPNGIMTSSVSNINSTGCPWPGTSNKTTFTDATTPNSKSWAAANTAKPLINIAENTSTKEVTFCFISCAAPNDPTNFTATPVSTSQINLGWLKNGNNDPVVVAYSLTGTFGTPVNGTAYPAGNTIPGGGTVLYNGANTTYNHTGLNSGTTYYYKAWSVMTGTTYSTGVITNATTFCGAIGALPFSESFSGTTIPSCWSQVDNPGAGNVWQFGVITATGAPVLTGNYAFLDSDAYGSGVSEDADLVSPLFNLTGYSNVTLQFSHYFRYYAPSTATLSYSINGGTSWTQIQQWTASTANPAAFSQVITAVAGQSQVKFKWNYTGTYGYWWAIDNVSLTGTAGGPSLTVTPSNQNVTAAAGTTPFTVTSNSAWTAASNQTWCTVTPSGTGNGTITATYSANTLPASRVANVTVTVTGLSPVIVTVTQAGTILPTLTVTPPNQNVAASAGTTPFSVASNSAWTVTSDQTWCTVTPSGSGNGTITATYTQNTGVAVRVANITVTVVGLSPVVVTVTQAGAAPALTVTPPNQNVAAPAGTTLFTVTCNTSWTVVSDQTWCTVTASGPGNGTITANYTQNTLTTTRVANITVSVSGLTPVVVTVTQAGAPLTLVVTPPNQNVTPPAGTTSFTVTSNSSWTAVSDQPWCLVTTAGTGNGSLIANYTENTATFLRVANVTVLVSGLGPVVVTVSQSGLAPTLFVTPLNQNVTFTAGSTNFSVASNSAWIAASGSPWCTVTPSGTGNGSLAVSYTQNTSSAPRMAVITVTVSGLTPINVTVSQDGSVGIADTGDVPFLIYPNPNEGKFRISSSGRNLKGMTVTITDIPGKVVKTVQCSGNAGCLIDISGQPGGSYLVTIDDGALLVVRKIVVR